MTDAQLKHWFTYHPPTDKTSPKYAAIMAAEVTLGQMFEEQVKLVKDGADPDFAEITSASHGFAEVINKLAPDSADKSAAIRCVRVGRMAANEAMIAIKHGKTSKAINLCTLAVAEWTKARWQANSAIACGGT